MEKIVIQETHGNYEFEVTEYSDDIYSSNKYYIYIIYKKGAELPICESDEYFEWLVNAIAAAKDHIDALESGER